MLIVFFVLSVLISSVGFYAYFLAQDYNYHKETLSVKNKKRAQFFYEYEGFYWATISVGLISLVCTIIAAFVIGSNLSGKMVIDDKIALYEEENLRIEAQIDEIVQNYQSWETNTYKEFQNIEPSVVISLYPELQSNEIVTNQITLYVKNNSVIKSLKEQKLDYIPLAWWLYFGN